MSEFSESKGQNSGQSYRTSPEGSNISIFTSCSILVLGLADLAHVCVSRFYDLKRKAKTIIYKPKAKLTETNNTKWRWAQAKKNGR
jgi:hypothetical protein